MSLFQIETELGELMAYREGEELTEEERATADGLIRQYVQREIEKVDGVRAYLRHCEVMAGAAKEEARRQTERQRAWQGRYDRLKETAQYAMELLGRKRLEGRTGSLTVKGNGGRQPVTVTDAAIVPDELCDYTVTIPGPVWLELMDTAESVQRALQPRATRIPRLSAIFEVLAQPCDTCKGTASPLNQCDRCGISGHQGVPGARLEPRGSHLEIR